MAKVATLEVEGVGAGLRLVDVKQVFESQSKFSEQSQVAKRISAALDFLSEAIKSEDKIFRSRSITQSFITMICHLQQSVNLKSKIANVSSFAKHFVDNLAAEVEKGQTATDADYIAFQRSVNANVKSGSVIRHKILLRKLFEFDPDFLDVVDAAVAASADYASEIQSIAKAIRADIFTINEAHAAKYGSDLFKATVKTAEAQSVIGEPIMSFESYKILIESLYFLLWEGPGAKLIDKPQSFKDVNTLRTNLQHDVDHGDKKTVEKKNLKHGSTFQKYAGSTSPSVASPARFPLLQLSLLKHIKADLEAIVAAVA